MTGNTMFNFGGNQPQAQPVQMQPVQPIQQPANTGYTGVKALAAKSADILLNRPRQALVAAATYDAKNNNGFLQDLKGGWNEVKAAMRGERPNATGSSYLQVKGMKEGLGRDLAGGALDILATPAFNPIMKAGAKIASPIQSAAGKRIAGSAAAGGIFGTADAFAAEKPTSEIANRAITDAILFGGVDAGLMGLGKVGGKLFNFSKPKTQPAEAAAIPAVEKKAAAPAFNFTGKPAEVASKETKDSIYNDFRSQLQEVFERTKLTDDIQDISGINSYMRDPYRNYERAFGKNFGEIERMLLEPFDRAKGANTRYQEEILQDLKENIVNRLGIKRGSPDSARVQKLGEGGYEKVITDPETGVKSTRWVKYTWDDLVKEVGEARAQQIAEADAWFRSAYDRLIDDVNKSKEAIYPFAEERMANIAAKIEDLKVPGKYSPKAQQDKVQALEWELNAMRDNRAKRGAKDTQAIQRVIKQIEELQTPGKYTRQAQIERLQALEWELNAMRKNPRRPKPEDSQYMQELVRKIEAIKNDPLYTSKGLRGRIENLQRELTDLRNNRPSTEDDTLYMKKLINKIEEVKTDPIYTAEGRRSMIEHLEKEYEKALRGKRVPKRKDYYRHFREMRDSYQGLKNIFDSPAQIDPALEGISYQTMPRSKWASFAQRRDGGAAYDLDAVGGFLDYVPAASRAVHIDPHISRFEALADELADATLNSKNANNLIRHTRELAQNIAGKTNPVDRFMQDFLGRKAFNVLNWMNSRVKANAILGNAGTVIAQLGNVPQGIAFAKQHSANGLKRTMKTLFAPDDAIKQSAFLTERFGNKMYRQFDDKLLDQPKNFAIWTMETSDRIGTEFIWNSCYEKALAEGIGNPIRFADINTRKLVAGRGIGEVPLAQQAKLFQVIAPFQIEVGNLWHVMSDTMKAKDFTGLAVLSVALWMFNRGAEQIRGTGVTFDPLDALIDAITDEDMTPVQRVGRLAGEVVSNVPGGQTLAALTMDDWQREKFFGDEDPTRYGTGLLAAKGAQNPLFRLVTPFGGAQLEKTLKAAKAIGQDGVYSKDGTKLRYPISTDLTNVMKGLLFGPGGFRESLDYYDSGGKPLTENQTRRVQQGGNAQYMQIAAERSKRALNSQLKAIDDDKRLTPSERAKKKAAVRQKYREQLGR